MYVFMCIGLGTLVMIFQSVSMRMRIRIWLFLLKQIGYVLQKFWRGYGTCSHSWVKFSSCHGSDMTFYARLCPVKLSLSLLLETQCIYVVGSDPCPEKLSGTTWIRIRNIELWWSSASILILVMGPTVVSYLCWMHSTCRMPLPQSFRPRPLPLCSSDSSSSPR